MGVGCRPIAFAAASLLACGDADRVAADGEGGSGSAEDDGQSESSCEPSSTEVEVISEPATGTEQHLRAVSSWIAVGDAGTILTRDYRGWTRRQLATTGDFRDVAAIDDKQAMIVVGAAPIIRTADVGMSWQEVEKPAVEATGITSSSEMILVFTQEGVVLRSPSGVPWEVVETGVDTPLADGFITDDGAAFAVGDAGTILVSADLGASWQQVDSGTTATLRAVSAIGDDVWVVGLGGTALYSDDGGASFEPAPAIAGVDFHAIHERYVAGSDGAIRSWAYGPDVLGETPSIIGDDPHPLFGITEADSYDFEFPEVVVAVGADGYVVERRLYREEWYCAGG